MKVTPETIGSVEYDLCIIGAGPAGIILALEYERLQPQHRVLLVEYGANGKLSKNRLDDSIQVMNEVNHHPPYECTNKGLGGTSASWGGRCVMYDEIDFLPRDILDGQCTWDTTLYHATKKYSAQTAKYFECGDEKFDVKELPACANSSIAEKFKSGDVTDSVIERWSMPTRFGDRYGSQIATSKVIHLMSGWEAFSLAKPNADRTITHVGLRNFSGGLNLTIAARKIVVAAGAQETTRLLLKNEAVFDQRAGRPDSLGKYYQGHVSGKIASVRFYGDPRKTDYGFIRTADGVYLRRRLQLSTQALLENRLLNTALWLDNPLYVDPSHRNGAMSFMYLAMITPGLGKRLAPPAVAHSITKDKVSGIPQHVGNILKGLPQSLFTPASIFFRRYCLKRKLPGVFLYSPINVYALHFHSEQVPTAENRMELASDGDTLVIHYKPTDKDVDSVIRTHEVLDAWLRECGCGELKYWFPKSELPAAIKAMTKDGVHQVGTTRISMKPEDGVVDHNLKVWGTANLFVCSSSVFPTSGQANPTFLLGTFAVRLAEHLSSNDKPQTIKL